MGLLRQKRDRVADNDEYYGKSTKKKSVLERDIYERQNELSCN